MHVLDNFEYYIDKEDHFWWLANFCF